MGRHGKEMAVSVAHKVRGTWQGHEVAFYSIGAGLSTVVKGN